MTKMKMIEDFVQQVANAMAAVLEVEVAIIDSHFRLVAGTGIYKDKIGMHFEKYSISYQVITTGKTFIIFNPREHEACRLCPHRSTCPDMAEICLPIIVQGEVIGTFALVALDEYQKKTLLRHGKKLLEFVAKISDLIGLAIDARQLTDKLSLLAGEFQAVVNSVKDGIIAIDSSGLIKQVNEPAERMLRLPKEQLINKNATDIFRDPIVAESLKSGSIINNQEIFAQTKGKKIYFLGNMTPIISNGDLERGGHVLVISNISEVKKLVGNYFLQEKKFTFDDIKGSSTVINKIKEKAKLIARSDSTILIQGESGTGKELFARAIHSASLRAEGPFVALNCGAIPESLLESELFGYDEGAFTGAKRGGKPGRFELANKGTLFLDELGDMPLHLQVKLLRVLEEKMVDRLGGTRSTPVDVRIIAATNKNLEKLVKRGEFRQDLYYRLNVIPLNIPPLRVRKEDILILLDCFRKKFNMLLGKNVTGYSVEAEKKLYNYQWPGNVRELENTIEYAINMEQTSIIQVASIPNRIVESKNVFSNFKGIEGEIYTIPEMEKQLIIKALKQYGTSITGKEKAAKALSLGIATLYRKIKKYKIMDELF